VLWRPRKNTLKCNLTGTWWSQSKSWFLFPGPVIKWCKENNGSRCCIIVISDFGGIYLDNDVIALKSFDDLRIFPFTLGRATTLHVSNSIMVSVVSTVFDIRVNNWIIFCLYIAYCYQIGERNAAMVNIWLESYGTFYAERWGKNSVNAAHKLWQLFPHLVHIELESLNHPTWQHLDDLYRNHYNLTQNYCLHIYTRNRKHKPGNLQELDGYNCTLGDALRLVLYGKADLRSSKTSNGYQHWYSYLKTVVFYLSVDSWFSGYCFSPKHIYLL